MNTNNQNINRSFNSISTFKISVRLPDWQRTIIDFCSEKESLSLSDIFKNAINSYFLREENWNRGELKQKTKDKYVQLNLFEWAERQQELERSRKNEEIGTCCIETESK